MLSVGLWISLCPVYFCGDKTPQSGPATSQSANADWPGTSVEDLVLLVKTARRSFEQRLSSGMETAPRYRPPSLADATGIVHLALRSHGSVIEESQSPEMNVLDAANAAGDLLAKSILKKKIKLDGAGRDLGLEFEWLGPREYIQDKYAADMKWSEGLLHSFDPAADGIGVELEGRRGWTRPVEIITSNYSPDLALLAAENRAGIKFVAKTRQTNEIKYFRFPSLLMWQESARSLPVRLYRGDTLITREQMDAKFLDAAIQSVGESLLTFQKKDGSFAQEYLLGSDGFKAGCDGDQQLAALTALATWAARKHDDALTTRTMLSVKRVSEHVRPAQPDAATSNPAEAIPGDELVVDYEDQQQCLESSARLCWVLERLGHPADYETQCKGLLKSLLRAQANDGHFELSFVKRDANTPEDIRGASWAIIAIHESAATEGRANAVLDKAQTYYQGWVERQARAMSPRTLAVFARAAAQLYANTKDARVSDTCFSILDHWAALQLDRGSCPWPELWGAINAGAPGIVGADTSCYVAALADGVDLAKRIGDQPRAEEYRKAIRHAARFIIQLQFRREGCFYVRFPQDVIGAVRAAPWDHRIRVDYCADALIALIRAREVLFDPPAGK
jgi:hypothetical protein